jgi:hypothetical protein
VEQVGYLIVSAPIIWLERIGCSHLLRRTTQQVIASYLEIIAKTKFLARVKLLS